MKKAFLPLIFIILLLGCGPQQDFKYGLAKLSEINSRYNTTIETYPKSIAQIDLMLADLGSLENLQLQEGRESFDYLVRYRTLNLEAEKLFIESQKNVFGNLAKTGFGCKTRPLIMESVALRNQSAQKGFEAASLLMQFLSKYPEDSKAAGLSSKNAMFLNASFYEMSRIARSDSNIINRFCPQNVTLELYREEFKKLGRFSENYINSLDYETAVEVWKEIRGLE